MSTSNTAADLHQALSATWFGIGLHQRPTPKRVATVLRRLHDSVPRPLANVLAALEFDGKSTPDRERAAALVRLLVVASEIENDNFDDTVKELWTHGRTATGSDEDARRLVTAVLDSLFLSVHSWWEFLFEDCGYPSAKNKMSNVRAAWTEFAARGVASITEKVAEAAAAEALHLRDRPSLRAALVHLERAETWFARFDDRSDDVLRSRAHWVSVAARLAMFDEIRERLAAWSLVEACDAEFGPTHNLTVEVRKVAADSAFEHDDDEQGLALLRETLWHCECDHGTSNELAARARLDLVIALAQMERLDEAIVVARYALGVLEPECELQPQAAVTAATSLARTLRESERYDECNAVAKCWYGFACDHLGPRHDLTHSLDFLAGCRD